MSIWFLTVGNSDVQLQSDANWENLYGEVRYNLPLSNCDNFSSLGDADDDTGLFSASARVLGLVYKKQDEYYSDLVFPLIATFLEKIPKDSLDKIYLILSDQSKIFGDVTKESPECPFWMDTSTLKTLITHYLKQEDRFPSAEIIPLIIEPDNTHLKGIDHWDYTLDLVSQTLQKDFFLSEGVIYVSHQAGTPAISSAVQFVSIGHSDRLQFLISNQIYDQDTKTLKYEAELIPSSKYWQRIQIQKAQKLLREGNPSAANTVLESVPNVARDKIKAMVRVFNLKPKDNKTEDEFKPVAAAERVRDALDLIEIFLENENYLEAIALLAAAHETFLKSAIIYLTQKFCNSLVNGITAFQIIAWDKKGLYLKSKAELLNEFGNGIQQPTGFDLAAEFCFPKPQHRSRGNSDPDYSNFSRRYLYEHGRRWTNGFYLEHICHPQKPDNYDGTVSSFTFSPHNFRLLLWLDELIKQKLSISGWSWGLLDWIGIYEREHNDDLRNQLVHNLRGIEKTHLLAYLKGEPHNRDHQDESENPKDVFRTEIKEKFVEIISKVFLKTDGFPAIANEVENHIQKELDTLSDRLM